MSSGGDAAWAELFRGDGALPPDPSFYVVLARPPLAT